MSKAAAKKSKYMGTYKICSACAKKKKWMPPNYPVTVSEGRCGYCKKYKLQMLTPIVDYAWPLKKVNLWD